MNIDRAEELIAKGKWRDVMDWAEAWLADASASAASGSPWSEPEAVQAANLLRLLAPLCGSECVINDFVMQCPCRPGECEPGPNARDVLTPWVRAVMLAKGEGWGGWLESNLGDDWPATRLVSGLHWYYCGDTRIYSDGTVECGDTLPPLPEVTL
jgi:hypothetical protein